MDRDEKKIMNRIRSDYDLLEQMGYTVLGVFLQGSQNYNLDDEFSDIDTKAIVLPSFEDFVLTRKPKSTTHILPSTEHVDIKDIRVIFDTFKKQNINFVEILFTKYYYLNPAYEDLLQPLLYNAEVIARYDEVRAVKCMMGMSFEKQKALTHPYPATMDKIEEFGFDPKQLHHIVRMNYFMKKYIQGFSYRSCLLSHERTFLKELKRGFINKEKITLEKAKEMSTSYVQETKDLADHFVRERKGKEPNQAAERLLNEIATSILREHFKKELN